MRFLDLMWGLCLVARTSLQEIGGCERLVFVSSNPCGVESGMIVINSSAVNCVSAKYPPYSVMIELSVFQICLNPFVTYGWTNINSVIGIPLC